MAALSNTTQSHTRRIIKINVDEQSYEEETASSNHYLRTDRIILQQLLADITPLFDEVIVIILEYYDSFAMIALSIPEQHYFSHDSINAISQNLSIIGDRHKDYRPNATNRYREKGTKILDIIDPSLFVHDLSTDSHNLQCANCGDNSNIIQSSNDIFESPTVSGRLLCTACDTYLDINITNHTFYQWIPSDITVTDTYQCNITSTINRFIRDDNDKDIKLLFEHYEEIIERMLPHFEDIIGYKLCGKELQIILKAIEYKQESGSYATVWHREGTKEEHIVAVGIFCTQADYGTLLQFTPNTDMVPSSAAVDFKPYSFFAVNTERGSMLVFNNELQHRLGMLQGSLRQVVVCMLVDPKQRILSFDGYNKDPLKINLNDAKERKKMVKAVRSERVGSQRYVPYCYDCGAYGHSGTMRESFLPTPHTVKL